MVIFHRRLFSSTNMSLSKKVAIVTGANKGIGYAIVKGLCERWKEGDVYLTARDETRGKNAVSELNKLGLTPIYHQLDITDVESIKRLRDHIQEKYGGIDILINNAAIAFKGKSPEPFGEQAEQTTFVNYFSLLSTCKILFPILKPGARVINLSSSAGHSFRITNDDMRMKLSDKTLTEAGLTELVKQFVESAKNGTHIADGWGSSAYSVSKVAVSALTFIQDREYGPKGMFVNCVHPGYVNTDMTSHLGPLTIEEGARAPLSLAIGDGKDNKGVYMWYDCSIVDWYSQLKNLLSIDMSQNKKVAIVTGANKGIGYGIVKGLCERWHEGDVYLTARDETRGKRAVAELNKLGLSPIYHQLDITDEESVKRIRDHIKEKYGGIDILINNAAIAFNVTTEPFDVQAKETIFVNYFSLVSTCKILFPILKPNAKVVNLSSSVGHLYLIPSEDLRKKLSDKTLTEPILSELVRQFVESAKKGTNEADGWGSSAYAVSKVAVCALTFIQDREYGSKGIFVNCVHPGYVDTDMTAHKGPLTIEEGAKAPLCLAIGDDKDKKEYRGVYMWYDCSIVDWYSELKF
ncbi:uncharacterized protein LOC143916636 [Arctopsyche grandis]|uniref:uncharacterized protein LOC143916636 n=1 Tax=Arctopsyche grandis TaxID=121162 RepID=UPI00406D655B